MLKEALEYTVTLGRQSAEVIVKPPAEPNHVYFVRKPDGSLEEKEAKPFPGSHEAFSLQAILAHATDPEASDVWYNATHIITRFGDKLRSRVTLSLATSPQYRSLQAWASEAKMLTQVEIVRALRTTFRDALESNPNLAQVLKKVNFKAVSSTTGEIGHGNASLGKEVSANLTGADTIPEYVKFTFPIYVNPCFRAIRATVECALEPDASNGTFRVIPLPGQMECAVESTLAKIAEEIREGLAESGVSLYFGKP